ncbi:prepilin-type N-terminal cleavage/methylation domain-containing protein [Actinoplanes sp. NPDC023936]|uniref:PulJ/GspJ family protein n=1 Tax=Actinoplanes sp. NPDC023936 TaxID=3154910 RepID=UPI0033C34B94
MRVNCREDRGFTLIELVVAMSIMGFFTAIVATAIAQMYHTANQAEATQSLQSRLNVVFERLDTEIRYAAAISTPSTGEDGQDHYVEYLNVNGGTQLCTELRLRDGVLQRRTWTSGDTPSGGWSTLAGEITSSTPFTVSSNGNVRQQLRLSLTATFASTGPAAGSHTTEFLFTALNSDASATTSNATVCGEGRAAP